MLDIRFSMFGLNSNIQKSLNNKLDVRCLMLGLNTNIKHRKTNRATVASKIKSLLLLSIARHFQQFLVGQ